MVNIFIKRLKEQKHQTSPLSVVKLLTSACTDTSVVTIVTHAEQSVQSSDVWCCDVQMRLSC